MDYLPNEWNNEERMRVMMGPLPIDIKSPAYESKINFWNAALHSWTKEKRMISFTENEAKMAFQRNSLTPASFKDVFAVMRFLLSPSQWLWSQVKKSIGYNVEDSSTYIDIALLIEISDKIVNEAWLKKRNEVFSMSSLYQFLMPYSAKLDDRDFILHYLKTRNKISTIKVDEEILVKVNTLGNTESLVISDAEIAKYKLSSSLAKLDTNMNELKTQIEKCQSEVKLYIRNGCKKEALRLLKRKKQFMAILLNLSSTYDNVTLCLEKLLESEVNREVVIAFRSGLKALKTSLSSENSVQDVENTVDELQDLLNECSEVSNIISSVGNQDIDHDFEEELADLMKNAAIESDNDVELPSAPENDPLAEIRNITAQLNYS